MTAEEFSETTERPQSEVEKSRASTSEQLLRAVLVLGILCLTPFVVVQFLLPIVLSHTLGIVVAILILSLMGTGLYIIAEGEIPTFLEN